MLDIADDPALRSLLAATGDGLHCAACGVKVTDATHRITVDGAHAHDVVNPAGLHFRIGCFTNADGARLIGTATMEWTWFQGFRWQVAICANCGVQLGWGYHDDSPRRFFGLMLQALRELGA